MIDTGPAADASEAGSRKIPEPTMLPTTSATAIHRPISRFSRGLEPGASSTVSEVCIVAPFLRPRRNRTSRDLARAIVPHSYGSDIGKVTDRGVAELPTAVASSYGREACAHERRSA